MENLNRIKVERPRPCYKRLWLVERRWKWMFLAGMVFLACLAFWLAWGNHTMMMERAGMEEAK